MYPNMIGKPTLCISQELVEVKVREHPVRLFPIDFVVADHFLPRKKCIATLDTLASP
jgi:hypothetical protein